MEITIQDVIDFVVAQGKNGTIRFDAKLKGTETIIVGKKPILDKDGNETGEFENITEEHDFSYDGIQLFGREDITQKKQELLKQQEELDAIA